MILGFLLKGLLPLVREQFFKLVSRTVMYPFVDITKVFKGIQVMKLAGLQQAEEKSRPLRPMFISREQGIFSVQSYWPDGALHAIVVGQ